MANNIIIELCAEDRVRLDKLTAALESRPDCSACARAVSEYTATVTQTRTEPTEAPKTETPADTHPIDEGLPWETAEAEAAPQTAKTYTISDLQEIARRLISPQSGKRDAAKEIITAYAPKISAIPEDKYGAVMAELIMLEKREG